MSLQPSSGRQRACILRSYCSVWQQRDAEAACATAALRSCTCVCSKITAADQAVLGWQRPVPLAPAYNNKRIYLEEPPFLKAASQILRQSACIPIVATADSHFM